MTPPLPEAVARLTESANGENQLTLGRNVFVQVADLKLILTTLQAMVEENETLRLEMLGGEDAPGYAASLSLEAVIASFKAHQAALRAHAEPFQSAIVEALGGLKRAAKSMDSARKAVATHQINDKDVHGSLCRARDRASELHSRLSNGLGLQEGEG